jgi:hypothetical protein
VKASESDSTQIQPLLQQSSSDKIIKAINPKFH